MRFLAICVLILVVSSSYSQNKAPQSTHGTINVLLGNKNGLVVVTDSRLSYDSRPLGEGQKLFVLDDHTVCSIAGFYSQSGPDLRGTYPLWTEVPGLIGEYLAKSKALRARSKGTSDLISEKLDRLSNIYTFALEIVTNLISVDFPAFVPDEAVLTVAGYEGKDLRIEGITLMPKKIGQRWRYVVSDRVEENVGTALVHRFTGLTATADEIFRHLATQRHSDSSILTYFAEQMAKNGGEDLSIEDMRQIANLLEIRTSAKNPNTVGGTRQTAILKDGLVASSELLVRAAAPSAALRVWQLPGARASFNRDGGVIVPNGYLAAIVWDGYFEGEPQRLDGIAFVNTQIRNSTLIYDGVGPAIFDKSNKVSDSTLVLGTGVTLDDPFVKKLVIDFPDLKISRNN